MMEWSVAAIGDVCDPTEQRDPRNDPDDNCHYVDITGIARDHKAVVRGGRHGEGLARWSVSTR